MKKFIKYFVVIFVSVVVIMIALDILYTYVYTNAQPRSKTQYLLKLKNKKIDYIFLGSSRVENHVVTKMVEEKTSGTAINIGVQGGKLDVTYLILQLLLENNIQFKKLFIQVDYSYNFEGNSIVFNPETIPFIRNNEIINKFHKKNNPDYLRCYYLPFYRYAVNDFKVGFREFFSSSINKTTSTDFSDGFEPRKDAFSSEKYTLPGTIVKSNKTFEQIDSLCKQKHIDVIYFCAPFCNQVVTSDFTQKLKQKIPTLKDYSKSILEDKYYVNCGHLNEAGAKLFTQMLIDDCILNLH
jgi:hypothetical protein